MWKRSGACAAIAFLGLTAGAAAAGPSEEEEFAGEEGIEFNDPLISECMAMVRDGRTSDAVARLNRAIRGSAGGSAEHTLDLKLGLAMVYLRSHQIPKALHMLRPIADVSGQDSSALRAVLLLRASKLMQSRRKNPQDWASVAGWQELLGDVRQDLAKSLEHEHAAMSEAIGRRSFDDISKHLMLAQQQVDLAQLIRLPNISSKSEELIRTHLAALRTEIFQFNTLLARMVEQADEMRSEPSNREYVGRHHLTHRKVIQDPQARAQYDQLWDEIERTADAGRVLALEYHRLLAENSSLRGFDQRVAIRVPARRPWHP